jgi:hypothetical protein
MRRMSRSAGVTVIATLSILGSLLCLAMAGLMVIVFINNPLQNKSLDPAAEPLLKVGLIVSIILFLALATWGIVTAIGLLRLQRWARISTLIFSGLLAFFGVISPLFVLAIPMPPSPGVDPAFMSGVKVGLTVYYLLHAAIGIWWMVYLTRPKVKAQFETGALPRQPSRRPLSISIIAWILIVATCFLPISLLLHMPAIVFGTVLTGWAANLYMILVGGVALATGVGLLRLKPYGRLLAIAYLVFGMLNGLTSYLLPGATERFQKMLDAMPRPFPMPYKPTLNPLLMAACMIPIMLVPLYLLVKNKKAFEPGPTPDARPLES